MGKKIKRLSIERVNFKKNQSLSSVSVALDKDMGKPYKKLIV